MRVLGAFLTLVAGLFATAGLSWREIDKGGSICAFARRPDESTSAKLSRFPRRYPHRRLRSAEPKQQSDQ